MMVQDEKAGLRAFMRSVSGAVSLDWIAMGVIVLILGAATAGSLGDDVEMVRSSADTLLDSMQKGAPPAD